MGVTPAAPILESPSAQPPEEESTGASGRLGENEQVALTTVGSVAVPEAIAGAAGSSGAEDGVAGDAPESGAAKPVAAKDQTAPPDALPGMVRPAVLPWSPLMVS